MSAEKFKRKLTAELPKDEPPVSSAFFYKSAKVTKGKEVQEVKDQ